ncbi:MAG: radical SAM protein [bacterium]
MANALGKISGEFEEAASGLLNRLRKRDVCEADLNFKLYSPGEGHPDWKAVWEKSGELEAEALKVIETDDGTPGELIAETQRIAGALATNAKSMAKNFARIHRGDHTLIPPYIIWTMHNACNFRCSYCDNHSGKKYFDLSNEGALDTEQGKKLLRIVRKDVTGIYFCGGEPTLRADLPELTDYAHGLDYFPLMINTNGSRIHKMLPDARYSKWLKQMDIIIVSLDALNIGRLTDVWGMKKDLCEQVMVNILALRRLQPKVRFKLIVNTVITPETIGEAESILDWANDLGIWYSPVPMNCGSNVNEMLTALPEYRALCAKILRRKKEGYKILGSRRLLENLLYSKKVVCRPSLKPHVDIDGSLIWPCKTKSNLTPVKINVLRHDSLDSAYAAGAKMINPTNIHGHGPGQCGADCNWMQNYVSDVYARGLENPLAGGFLAEMFEFTGIV